MTTTPETTAAKKTAAMTKVFLLQSEHPTIPGMIIKLYASKAGADAMAAELLNDILCYLNEGQETTIKSSAATAETWRRVYKLAREKQRLETDIDIGDWYVEVSEQMVEP